MEGEGRRKREGGLRVEGKKSEREKPRGDNGRGS